eukprot:SAG31_NODE_3145_length_4621_cov_2.448695_2_plen_58_part_00
MNNGQSIAALLITPIQRIPRYVMLLNELKKYTTSGMVKLSLSVRNVSLTYAATWADR